MAKKKYKKLAAIITLALFISVYIGCGNSDSSSQTLSDNDVTSQNHEDEITMQDIPHYPNATEGEAMGQSSPGGIVSGNLEQFTTSDPYDKVLDFYKDALDKYNPEFMSYTSELGRQTAISIPLKNGMISVSIQEFTAEGTVNITFMAVGG